LSDPGHLYPAWFLDPQLPSRECAAAGYSTRSRSGTEAAIKDAIAALVRCERVDIVARRGYVQTSSGLEPQGAVYRENADESRLARISQHAVVLDTAWVGSMVIVLASTREIPFSDNLRASPRKPPSWTTRPPLRDGAMTAVGVSEPGRQLHDAWRRAEKAARRELAFQIVSRVQGMSHEDRDAHMAVLNLESEVEMLSFRVLARYHDHGTNMCYVLAECSEGSRGKW